MSKIFIFSFLFVYNIVSISTFNRSNYKNLELNADKVTDSTNLTTSEDTSVYQSWKCTILLKNLFFSVQILIYNGTVLSQVSGTVFPLNLTTGLTRMMTKRTQILFFFYFRYYSMEQTQ